MATQLEAALHHVLSTWVEENVSPDYGYDPTPDGNQSLLGLLEGEGYKIMEVGAASTLGGGGAADGWISVKDRLPEHYQRVALVSAGASEWAAGILVPKEVPGMRTLYWDVSSLFYDAPLMDFNTYTHWLPLPDEPIWDGVEVPEAPYYAAPTQAGKEQPRA